MIKYLYSLIFFLFLFASLKAENIEWYSEANAYQLRTEIGQTFTIGTVGENKNYYLQTISQTYNRVTNEVVLYELFATSSGLPTGSAISTGSIPADGSTTWATAVQMSSVLLQPGTQYFIKISSVSQCQFYFKISGTYAGGTTYTYNGSSWEVLGGAGGDLAFAVTGISTLSPGVITDNQTICYNVNPDAFLSSVGASGGTGTLTYTWQYSTTSNIAGSGSWSDIGSSNTATYDPAALTTTTYYTRKVTDDFNTFYTNVVTITVYPQFTSGVVTGTQTICYSADVAAFTSTSPASGGSGIYTYLWQRSTTSSTAGSGTWYDLSGSNSTTYDPGALNVTNYYTRRVLNECGILYSNVLTVTVRPILVGGTVAANQTIAPGADVAAFTSSVSASGGSSSFTYTWQYSTTSNVAGSGVWIDIPSSNSTTYNHGTLTETTWFVRRASDASCGITYSNVLKITVTTAAAGDCNPKIYDPLYRYTSDNTDADSSVHGRTIKRYGAASYTSTTKAFGSHSLTLDGGNDWARIPKVDYGDKMFFSFWARTQADITTDRMFFCIANSTSNFYVMGKATNSVRVYTSSNSTSAFTVSSATWHHFGVYLEKKVSNTAVRVWLDGSRVTLLDSLVLLTFNSNDSIRIGADYYGNSDFYGQIDEFMAFTDFEPTNDDIACLVNGNYIGTASPEPVAKKRKPLNRVVYFQTFYDPSRQADPVIPPVDPPADVPVYGGYNPNYALAVKQKFAIPEDVNTNDHVGTWLKTWTWQSVGAISYSLQNSHDGAFAINPSTGLISISNAAKIDGKIIQQDTVINLIVRTYDSGLRYEDDTAQVWVKERAYCHFYNWSGSGTGLSRTTPAHYMPTTGAKTPGHAYFMERGKTFLNGGMISFSFHLATAEHPTIIGAYGAGAKPRFRDTGNDANADIGFFLGYNVNAAPWYDTNPDRLAKHIYFYDLHMQNYYSSAFKSSIPNCEYGFYNLDIMNCNRYGNDDAFKFHDMTYLDSAWVMPTELINVRFDTAGISGLGSENKAYIKIGSGPVTITNCWFGPFIDQFPCFAFRITNGKGSIIRHSYTKGDNPYTTSLPSTALGGIQVRQKDVKFIDNVFEGVNNGVYVITPSGPELNNIEDAHVTPARLTFRNNWFKNNLYAGLRFHQSSTPYWPYANMLIEDNLFTPASGANVALVIRDFLNSTIRRNQFIGAAIGLLGSTNEASNNVTVSHNLFTGQTGNSIEFTAGTGLKYYHNTVYGVISLTGTVSPVVTNNLYRALLGSYTGSNNFDLDGLNIYNNFVDPLGGNWKLLPASTLIDQGIDLTPQPSPDLTGITVPQGTNPDPGANEFPQE